MAGPLGAQGLHHLPLLSLHGSQEVDESNCRGGDAIVWPAEVLQVTDLPLFTSLMRREGRGNQVNPLDQLRHNCSLAKIHRVCKSTILTAGTTDADTSRVLVPIPRLSTLLLLVDQSKPTSTPELIKTSSTLLLLVKSVPIPQHNTNCINCIKCVFAMQWNLIKFK